MEDHLAYYEILVVMYRLGFLEVEGFTLLFGHKAGIGNRMAAHDMKYEGNR